MKYIILGAGGVGCYYGARLIQAGHEVIFIARGEHLASLQKNGLTLNNPEIDFCAPINAMSLEKMENIDMSDIDAIVLATKSMETREIAKLLQVCFHDLTTIPYCLSLQNGVENENILCEYIESRFIIGGLTRKIGAHIIQPGVVQAVGKAETIIGLLHEDRASQGFIEHLTQIFNDAGIPTVISVDIQKELWKKLIINNGVNALCALLEVKTGVVMRDVELSKIVLGLMTETALAAEALHVNITDEDVQAMFELILGFDSIKPSMLVDVEHKRKLEIEEICGIVIRYCEKKGRVAPYTQTISTLLKFKMENLK